MDYVQLAKKIETIARNAGLKITSAISKEIMEKGGSADIVTNMDLASQRYIMSECAKLIPESTFIAEEDNVRNISDGYTWVIDPIDGTTNYAYEYKHSCISIALLHQKRGVIGVVYNPYLNEAFVGVNGEGSRLNEQPIHLSQNKLRDALVLIGTSPYHKEKADMTFDLAKRIFLNCRDIRRSSSAAMDLCYVASGRVDAYYEESLSPWDFAAGEVILRNAGGKLHVLEPETFNYDHPIGLVAANQECFEDMVKLIEEGRHE